MFARSRAALPSVHVCTFETGDYPHRGKSNLEQPRSDVKVKAMTAAFSRLPRFLSALLIAALSALALRGSSLAANSNVEWPTYGSTYGNTRHVNVDTITSFTLAHLAPVWRFVLGSHERVESTPIVVGRTLYMTTGVGNNVFALDATTGKLKWRYRPALGFMSPCCGALNRGVAVSDGRVFFATLDAQLIALDAQTGKPLWKTQVGDAKAGFSETMAPLAWNGAVFIGSSGSDYGIRGSLSAYRASDGKLLWRWYAVSKGWEGSYTQTVHGMSLHRNVTAEKHDAMKYANAWMHGGGAIWMTPALDERRGTLFLSTNNPAPVFNGSVRPGDNLYTDSVVALEARTGKMLWYYQQTPHDVWEYEPASPPVLFDALDKHGHRIPVVAEAGKTRWLYILDRRNGRLVRLSQSWGGDNHLYDPPAPRSEESQLPLRGTIGPIAYDPAHHLALVTSIDRPPPNQSWSDVLSAVDVDNGKIVWRRTLGDTHQGIRGDPVLAGALSAGNLIFVSDPFGYFSALDASSGDVLWQYRLGRDEEADIGAPAIVRLAHRVRDFLKPMKRWLFHQDAPTGVTAGVDAAPIAYRIGGREYIAIGFDTQPESATGGATIFAFALSER
jgi:alcohol dehydrogenase (cytochrome c)